MGAVQSKKLKKFRISYSNSRSNSMSSGSNNINGVRNYLADESEIDQMNIQHHLIREVWNGNFSSPIKEKLKKEQLKVLQVSCGPGSWLCEMSSDYPKCSYTGVDNLELVTETKPSNVKFIKCSFLQGLPFKDNTFDFVFMRFKVLEFTEHQWESFVVRELTRVLKPNGWIELMEPSIELCNMGPLTRKINDTIVTKIGTFNINTNIHQRIEEFMRDTKLLINIESFVKQVPCGNWAGKVGEAGAMVLRDGFLKHMGLILSQKANSSPSSFINEILSYNDSNSIFDNNRQQHKESIIGGRSDSVKNKTKSNNNNDDDDSGLKTVLENYLNEANIYKTTFDTFRFIGQKIVT